MRKKLLYNLGIALILNIIIQAQTVMLDPSFSSDGIATFSPGTLHDVAYDIKVLPDTTMIVFGTGKFNGFNACFLMKILNDGTQDMTFGSGGITILQFGVNTYASKMAIQPDGKIMVCGICYVTTLNSEFFVARLLLDGTLDSTFGTNGHSFTSYSEAEEYCYAMAIQNDGKIILAGRVFGVTGVLLFTRFNSNGSLDSSFGTNGYTAINSSIQSESIQAINLLSNGTIVGFGYGYKSAPYYGEKVLMAKLDTSGMPITNFGTDGVLYPSVFTDVSAAYGLQIENDSLYVTGYIYDAVNDNVLFISKLDQEGNGISTFGTNGITVTKPSSSHYNIGHDLKISDDGKIYACGTSGYGYLTSPRDFILLRYTQDGMPDASFTSTGYIITSIGPDWDEANALDFQNDRKVVLAGLKSGYSTTGNNDAAIVRYIVSDLIITPTTFPLSVNVSNGWNMVSVPGTNPNGQGVDTWWVYRDMNANVFKYSGGYQPITTTTPGIGYWMKHTGARTYNTGDEWPADGIQIVTHDPIVGASGWNLFGGYELSVGTAGLTTNPPGLITGSVYKYSGGYQVATTLDPGYGYWVKLTGAGQIIIPEALAKSEVTEIFNEDWGKIILTDATGVSYTLYAVNGDSPNCEAGVDLNQYELPPAPPEGMFDIRFLSGRVAEDINSRNQTIEMRGVKYPVSVKVENINVALQDETAKEVNVVLKKGEDVVISDATIQKLIVTNELIPDVYSLEQNYPNPFNPSTVIEFSLPENVNSVKLTIYNVLGEKVAELVNTSLIAGKYSYRWDARNVATGMYIYELRTDKFVSVRKMVLMK